MSRKIYKTIELVYEPEAIALFDRMTALGETPDDIRKMAINEFIYQEKLCGNWSKYDNLYFQAAHGTGSSKLCWNNASLDITSYVNVTFTVDGGVIGNGSSTTIPVSYSNFTRNNASSGVYINSSNVQHNGYVYGSGGIDHRLMLRSSTNQANYMINDGAGDNVSSITSNSGLTVIRRTGAAIKSMLRNGVVIHNGTTSSSPSVSSMVCPSTDSANRVAFFFLASGSLNFEAQYKNVQQYLTAIGAAV